MIGLLTCQQTDFCPLWFTVWRYSPKDPTMVSETVHYKRGVSQQFSMPSFKIDFSEWKEEDVSFNSSHTVLQSCIRKTNLVTQSTYTGSVSKQLFTFYTHWYLSFVYNHKICALFPLKLNFDLDRGVFPMVIQAVVDEGDGRLLELCQLLFLYWDWL